MNRTSPLAPDYGLYGEPARAGFPDLVHIERLVERSGPRRWRISAHRHPALHQLFWIADGGGVMRLGEEERALRARMLISLPAGTVHGFRFQPGTEGWVITLPDTVFEPIRAALDPGRRLAVAHLVAVDTPPPDLEALAAEHAGHARLRGEALQARLTLILVWLLRELSPSTGAADVATSPGNRLYGRFLDLLDTQQGRLRSVSDYADALAVSAPHLSRVCRRESGKPASALLRARQMLEARRLLAYTQIAVAEIAYRLGFSDPAHFSRVFSAETGLSPRAFRKGFTDRAE